MDDITYKAMMGEYIIYYRGKIAGGIYDDRLLVKPTKSALKYMSTVTCDSPYNGAKEMLLVDEVDSLCRIRHNASYTEKMVIPRFLIPI